MKKMGLAALTAAALAIAAACPAQTLADYKLHPGDKLLVGVYDDPKLVPQEITVAPDGKISFPLVGVLMVGGKTVEQIRNEHDLMKDFADEVVGYLENRKIGLALTKAAAEIPAATPLVDVALKLWEALEAINIIPAKEMVIIRQWFKLCASLAPAGGRSLSSI